MTNDNDNYRNSIEISKEVLNELPSKYKETRLGDSKGARKQYRSSSSTPNIHVREYEDKFTIHIDHADPRKHPIQHLLRDSPETIAAAAATTSLYFSRGAKLNKYKARSNSFFSSLGFLGLIGSFLALNSIFKLLKEILFS